MIAALASAAVSICLTNAAGLDREVGRRALPWMPPDLARQVTKHERDFNRGAAAAAAWPASYHRPGDSRGLERAITAQCERLVAAIRGRAPFSEVVAGLGALAHFTTDLDSPLDVSRTADPKVQAFAAYAASVATRIPVVFYGQDRALIRASTTELPAVLRARRRQVAALDLLVRDDLDRAGGPAAWRALDDRSTSFGAASLVLNHAASDFSNLASWVWQHAGGLVPPLPERDHEILVWVGDPRPRDLPGVPGARRDGNDATRPRLGLRQSGP
ncbi:MAG: hypothetical protein ACM3O7_07075 [Acidobacteriota bacterium]